MNKEEIKKYIYNQIRNGNFSYLPQNIAGGVVYKIPSYGNLTKTDIELAYLYLREGSFILSHEHINDIERYKCIDGILRINGNIVKEDICKIYKRHSIDNVEVDTIIETFKIKNEYLIKNDIKDINTETFDKILTKSLVKR